MMTLGQILEAKTTLADWVSDVSSSGSPKEQREKLASDIEKEILKIFPKSYVKADYGESFIESIYVRFAVGRGSDEWANGIINNDVSHNTIVVTFPDSGATVIDAEGSMHIMTKPTNKYSAYGHVKVPFRKSTVKDGSHKKILSVFKKAFTKLRDKLREEVANGNIPDDALIYIKGKI